MLARLYNATLKFNKYSFFKKFLILKFDNYGNYLYAFIYYNYIVYRTVYSII